MCCELFPRGERVCGGKAIRCEVNGEDKINDLKLLQSAVEEKHQCRATHSETVHVHETLEQTTIWDGDVEVFTLEDHPEADKCYAWSYRETGAKGNVLNSENV